MYFSFLEIKHLWWKLFGLIIIFHLVAMYSFFQALMHGQESICIVTIIVLLSPFEIRYVSVFIFPRVSTFYIAFYRSIALKLLACEFLCFNCHWKNVHMTSPLLKLWVWFWMAHGSWIAQLNCICTNHSSRWECHRRW